MKHGLSFYVDSDEYEAIRAVAAEKRESISMALRFLVRQGLKTNPPTNAA